jgi:hypothetical protein
MLRPVLIPIAVFLTGCPGQVLEWTVVEERAPEGAFLMAWGATSNDVWVVGGQPDAGVVLRGDAGGFAPHPLPEGTPILNWVHGTSVGDVWVGGVGGTLLHWDGSEWEDHSIPMEEAIWGIHARSPTEAWAVGGTSAWGGSFAVALRWDGEEWTALDLPPPADEAANLFKVTHDGTHLWMVGTQGLALRSADGETLEVVYTGVANDLVTVHTSDDAVLVVGGRGTGLVLEPEDDALATTLRVRAGLSGVHLLDARNALVVGEAGLGGLYDLETDLLEEAEPVTTSVLHGAFAAPDGTLYAVGGNLYSASDAFEGTLLSAPSPF